MKRNDSTKKHAAVILGTVAGAAGALLLLLGICKISGHPLIIRPHTSVSIIGGADGPTSIFLAGKIGGGASAVYLILGAVLLLLSLVLLLTRRRRR